MNVVQYTFQSPYSSPVQVGKIDPSSVKEEESNINSTQAVAENTTVTSQIVQEAQTFQATQVGEVKPTVESNQLLDVYA